MSPKKPPVPSGNSAVWHNRRWRDGLGYYRVRSMANPNWNEPQRLIRRLGYMHDAAQGEERDLIDRAIAATKSYAKQPGRGGRTAEQAAADDQRLRRELFEAVDALLNYMQIAFREWQKQRWAEHSPNDESSEES